MADKFGKVNFNDYKPLRDVIFESLREAIINGDLKPGERLLEIHLANKMGVSRTPVREAVRKLELEGFVTMIPRRGAMVADLSTKQIKEVLEIRASLDGLAAELACERITEDKLQQLKDIQQSFIVSVEKENIQNAIKRDVEFHERIYEAAHNDRLLSIVNNLREQMQRFRVMYIRDIRALKSLIDEHEEIINAIERKDKESARIAAQQHIDNQENEIAKRVVQSN